MPHKSGYAACTGVLRESISMKPDVKKIIADIKATEGNRKFCNGLAGTLQDDNYASSICKYVKTVTPERIDLLIEYAEKLEAEVTDLAVQLANAESKCRELAAESGQMLRLLTNISENHDEYVNQDEYLYAGVPMDYVSEINSYVSCATDDVCSVLHEPCVLCGVISERPNGEHYCHANGGNGD